MLYLTMHPIYNTTRVTDVKSVWKDMKTESACKKLITVKELKLQHTAYSEESRCTRNDMAKLKVVNLSATTYFCHSD